MQARVIRLKDGREAVIRPARLSDAPDLLESQRRTHAAGIGVVRALDELPQTVREQEEFMRDWITGPRSGPNGLMLVAEVAGSVVGEATIRRHPHARIRHAAHVAIEVGIPVQGLGIGRALMEGLIAWAASGPGRGVTRLGLFVFADNHRAISLYRSVGFVEEGRRRNFIRQSDGTMSDDLLMALLL